MRHYLPATFHHCQLLYGTAANGVVHEIGKITLEHTHRAPFVIGNSMSGQLTRLTTVNSTEIGFFER